MDRSLFSSMSLMLEPSTSILTLGGAELPHSRRYVDLDNSEACRWQYAASNSIDVTVDYSLDNGDTWQTLATEYETIGGNLRVTAWQTMPDEAKAADVMLRSVASGTGLLTTVHFVEFQFR